MSLPAPGDRVRVGLLVLGVALGLRLLPVAYGLPHTYRYDEARYVQLAGQVGVNGPRIVDYGYGPLFPYLTAAGFGVVYAGGAATGRWSSSEEFREAYYEDPTPFFVTARSISALAGALAALVLLFGSSHWMALPPRRPLEIAVRRSRRPGAGALLAAGALAVLPVSVLLGAQAGAESLVLLLVSLWLWGAGRYLTRGRARDLLLAGVALGLAVTAKYNAFVFLPWQAALVALSPRSGARRSMREWGIGVLAPGLGLVLGAPFAALEPRMAWLGFRFNMLVSSEEGGSWLHGIGGNLVALLTGSEARGLGLVLGICLALGTVIGIARLGRYGIWLATAGWGFVLATSVAHTEPVPRYLIPAYPLLLILAGLVLELVRRETDARGWQPPGWLPQATALALLLPASIRTGSEELRLIREDTRTTSARWIQENLPAGASILLEDGVASPPLAPAPESVDRDPRGPGRAAALSRTDPTYALHWIPVPWGMATAPEAEAVAFDRHELPGFDDADREKLSLDYWRTKGVTHAAVSSYVNRRYFETDADELLPYRTFYRSLLEQGTLIHREDPRQGDRPGPLVLIYRLPD